MRYLKMFGLAAVATMALTATFGATSASATVLCTTTATPCGSAWHVDEPVFSLKNENSFIMRATSGVWEGETCSALTMNATKQTTGSSTTTPVGTVTKVNTTWGGCTNTTHTLAGGEIEVHHIVGTDNGTVTAKGFEITTRFLGISCVYGYQAGTDLGILTGGHNPVLSMAAVVNKVGGSFACPADVIWEGQFTLTNHTRVYVVAS